MKAPPGKGKQRPVPPPSLSDTPWTIGVDPGEHPGWAMAYKGNLQMVGNSLSTFPVVQEGTGFIEFPCIRPGTPNPNSIVRLAWTGGAMAATLRARGWRVRELPVATWKGSRNKKAHGNQILAALSPVERMVLGDHEGDHNVIDAVGILLYGLGRMA